MSGFPTYITHGLSGSVGGQGPRLCFSAKPTSAPGADLGEKELDDLQPRLLERTVLVACAFTALDWIGKQAAARLLFSRAPVRESVWRLVCTVHGRGNLRIEFSRGNRRMRSPNPWAGGEGGGGGGGEALFASKKRKR